MNKLLKTLFYAGLIGLFVGALSYIISTSFDLNYKTIEAGAVMIISLLLSVQSIFTLTWMLYAWENLDDPSNDDPSDKFLKPIIPFTALLPARHEELVVADTIKALDRLNYPDHLKELLILCRSDDFKTIAKAQECIDKLGKGNIRLITFNEGPINKPHALNIGIREAKNPVIAIFDAEDEPHPDIYNLINTIMVKEKADVVQAGVQLMNFKSHWFSALNVIEYYFWFKSGLKFFTKFGKVTPLGGNTVFFKKAWVNYIGGWDENCLTEDADIGIRLSAAGAKSSVYYNEQYSTKEETPSSTVSFIKQRTRWNQGFLQILSKNDWTTLPLLKQKLIVLYVLLSPIFQALLFLYIPLGVLLATYEKLPILVSLISYIPLFLILMQMIVYIIGLYKFTVEYKLSFTVMTPFRILLSFIPYQLILVYSSFRALTRFMLGSNAWEKTSHINAHRNQSTLPSLS